MVICVSAWSKIIIPRLNIELVTSAVAISVKAAPDAEQGAKPQ